MNARWAQPFSIITPLLASVRPRAKIRHDRLWEVDALRGIAIVLMVIYHLVWDLYGLAGWDIAMYGLLWTIWQRITAGLFIFLVGVSLHLRTQRMQTNYSTRPFLTRGLVIFTWGFVISLVTFMFQPAEYVRFGILHFIGVAILLAFPLAQYMWINLPAGLLLLFLPKLLTWRHDVSWLEWVGLVRAPHPAFDYFPLIPWLCLVLIGIFVGHVFFPRGRRLFNLSVTPQRMPWLQGLQLAGQNALLIYLVHQPLLILTLTLVGVIHW